MVAEVGGSRRSSRGVEETLVMPARITLNPNSLTEVASSIIPVLQAGRLEYSGSTRSTRILPAGKNKQQQSTSKIQNDGRRRRRQQKETINQITGGGGSSSGGTAAAAAAVSSERPKAIGDQRGGVAAAVPWWRSVGGRSMGGRWPAGSRGTVVRYSIKIGGRSRDTPTLLVVGI